MLSNHLMPSPSTSAAMQNLKPKPFQMRQTTVLDQQTIDFVSPSFDKNLLADDRILSNLLIQEEALAMCGNQDYFSNGMQHEIRPQMREIVVNWMHDVCEEENTGAEVFLLAVSLMDRFLCRVDIFKTQFQTLAATCLLVASKVKLPQPISGENIISYTADSFAGEIISWELLLMSQLDWNVSTPTAFDFLERVLLHLDQPQELVSEIREDCIKVLISLSKDHTLAQLAPSIQAAVCIVDCVNRQALISTQVLLNIIEKCLALQPQLLSQLVSTISCHSSRVTSQS